MPSPDLDPRSALVFVNGSEGSAAACSKDGVSQREADPHADSAPRHAFPGRRPVHLTPTRAAHALVAAIPRSEILVYPARSMTRIKLSSAAASRGDLCRSRPTRSSFRTQRRSSALISKKNWLTDGLCKSVPAIRFVATQTIGSRSGRACSPSQLVTGISHGRSPCGPRDIASLFRCRSRAAAGVTRRGAGRGWRPSAPRSLAFKLALGADRAVDRRLVVVGEIRAPAARVACRHRPALDTNESLSCGRRWPVVTSVARRLEHLRR